MDVQEENSPPHPHTPASQPSPNMSPAGEKLPLAARRLIRHNELGKKEGQITLPTRERKAPNRLGINVMGDNIEIDSVNRDKDIRNHPASVTTVVSQIFSNSSMMSSIKPTKNKHVKFAVYQE